jgi:hypothetical protein
MLEPQNAELDGAIPTLELQNFDEATLRVLHSLQRIILKHPLASQSAFSALIAEGKMFEKTLEGRELKARLEGSSMVRELRYIFDLSTFSLLEHEPLDILPSAYLDTLFMLARSDRSDELLDCLFRQAASE